MLRTAHKCLLVRFTMKKTNFYRSCDIIEFIDGEDAEGLALAELFKKNGVRYILKRAQDYSSIEGLFESFTNSVLTRNAVARSNGEPLYAPELHLSCHGNRSGIGWKDGSLVPWKNLADLLWSYSWKIGYFSEPQNNGAFAQATSLISLSLSCCSGAHAAPDFYSKEPYPVGGFLAPTDTIYIDDCAEFMLRLYTLQLNDPWQMPEKVREIHSQFMPNGPTGDVPFQCFPAPLSANPNYSRSGT